mmetsp:Transcript_5090/g.8677  ORF Transcript_5090/g.8677 Transcript_5090/m.8677 type:complete len:102 (+) Transcript_5090:194-499(+)
MTGGVVHGSKSIASFRELVEGVGVVRESDLHNKSSSKGCGMKSNDILKTSQQSSPKQHTIVTSTIQERKMNFAGMESNTIRILFDANNQVNANLNRPQQEN